MESWTDLRTWLKKEMPNQPNDQMLILLMKSYNNQAKEMHKQKKLGKDFEWMTVFDL